MQERTVRTVVIGSGCAGLNAADTLAALGEKDFVLVTENMLSGTSRNTGSDKQTYYKLSLAGDDGDSVGDMARTLKRDDVHGDTALCEAAGSARCFLKLAALGVPFPMNGYGEYVGYQTDHDTRRRASSAGPLTSRYMTEALEKSVRARGVEILDRTLAFRILTGDAGVTGVMCLETDSREWLLIRCAHVVLCTGGPAMIYRNSVYPVSQFGMSGMAFEAGAEGANLDCWQYGLASVKFRWNVSGSYQQALPRYVSVDESGVEREFLADALGPVEAMNRTFLKGYQWPFDPRKVDGSSRVDILVKAEEDKGHRVYMDFMHNPAGYDLAFLSDEARDYLINCGADKALPIERLRAINAPAIELYRSHHIDLEREMLEVRVCAQHHNGGLAVDAFWQTSVPGLYACGEAAGTFGRYRP
ncbi:MAG: FAD-binding protein, partial [Aristaeellaceae bacterium]